MFTKKRAILATAILLISLGLLTIAFLQTSEVKGPTLAAAQPSIVPFTHAKGWQQISTVQDRRLAVYNGEGWDRLFWAGLNLGASTPGYSPGDLSPTREDYMRWFEQMEEMHTRVIRIYTILPPHFYEALYDFNASRDNPMLLLHGIWSPEEELIGEDMEGRDAYSAEITDKFRNEIKDAVAAVHGQAVIEPAFGHASGTYSFDVSPYVLGWVVGTEWYPYAVLKTDLAHAGMPAYKGEFFEGTPDATPFENWLAMLLDLVASEDMRYGWQRPIAFTNWVTTDPLIHPNEPLEQEDLVSVDPMHVSPTAAWEGGYFAAYHVYPYYPDFLRFEPSYLTYIDKRGEINPYAAYLNELRAHHADIPLFIAEFGLPSSRGIAHYSPQDYNQGMHSEIEQGEMLAEMLQSMVDEDLDGALLFEWHDEWFKFTWNTIQIEENRAVWRNRLTNEEHFGLLAVEPGRWSRDLLKIDGEKADWQWLEIEPIYANETFSLSVHHDESDLYLLLEKHTGAWNLHKDELYVGFDSLPGGALWTDAAPGVRFEEGIETLLRFANHQGEMLVNSAYDQHTWRYGAANSLIEIDSAYADDKAGILLPWKLPTDLGLYLPLTEEIIPFQATNVGLLIQGISDPQHPEYHSLADWFVNNEILEIRLPWMLLGFTDPGQKQVWDYLYRRNAFVSVPIEALRIQPALFSDGASTETEMDAPALSYTWENWSLPRYHERKKKSFYRMKEEFNRYYEPLH